MHKLAYQSEKVIFNNNWIYFSRMNIFECKKRKFLDVKRKFSFSYFFFIKVIRKAIDQFHVVQISEMRV